jgi:large subunit ribosomal protein L17
MKHRVSYNRLGRKTAHRKALYRAMVTALFRYERVKTTKAKAREIRRVAEKIITRAREDSVHNRRLIARNIQDKQILAKLFVEIAPRFLGRPGGYTRILKLGQRYGDASEMVLLELVERKTPEKDKKEKKTEKKSAAPAKKEAAKPKAAKPKAAKPEAAKVEAAKVEAAKPEAAKVEAAKPEAAKVEAAKPEAAKPETEKTVSESVVSEGAEDTTTEES